MTLKDIFTVETFEKYKLSEPEVKALMNVIELAKERIWLAKSYPKRPEPSFDFTEDMGSHDIEVSERSIAMIQKAVHLYHTND